MVGIKSLGFALCIRLAYFGAGRMRFGTVDIPMWASGGLLE